MSPPPKITRRGMTIGGAVAIGAALVAGGIFEGPRLFKRRARGRYADLVNRLENPEQAALVGRAVLDGAYQGFRDDPPFEEEASSDLRERLAENSISQLMSSDSEMISHMVEADGWVIPVVLAELSILAAKSI